VYAQNQNTKNVRTRYRYGTCTTTSPTCGTPSPSHITHHTVCSITGGYIQGYVCAHVSYLYCTCSSTQQRAFYILGKLNYKHSRVHVFFYTGFFCFFVAR
jgi:hypothetical protein